MFGDWWEAEWRRGKERRSEEAVRCPEGQSQRYVAKQPGPWAPPWAVSEPSTLGRGWRVLPGTSAQLAGFLGARSCSVVKEAVMS